MNFIARVHDRLVFRRRARVLSELLAGLLPNEATVLDVGCGDGLIDKLILERRPDVTVSGIDVMVRPSSRIPVTQCDGTSIS